MNNQMNGTMAQSGAPLERLTPSMTLTVTAEQESDGNLFNS